MVAAGAVGGDGNGVATVTNNHITIQETNTGIVGVIASGVGFDGLVSFNTVTIQGSRDAGHPGFNVAGGFATNNGTAEDNTVYIGKDSNGNGTYSGTVDSDVLGGVGDCAERNHVFISGGTVTGDIYGSLAETSANNNTVSISTSGTTYKDIYGGGTATAATGDLFVGSTLNLHTSGMTAANVYNFENLNFFLPSTLTASTTPLLTVNSIYTNLECILFVFRQITGIR
ncbi:hypothetical protein FACS189454_03560 [Planctomycetales bacterium]|nr:hypothetical protein FACS189454_03560 [Planctomycetales bacterium]